MLVNLAIFNFQADIYTCTNFCANNKTTVIFSLVPRHPIFSTACDSVWYVENVRVPGEKTIGNIYK